MLLTDILALFAENPLAPAMWDAPRAQPTPVPGPVRWIEGRAGVVEIGHDGAGFAFDCEGPRHSVFLHPHLLADRPVINAEWEAEQLIQAVELLEDAPLTGDFPRWQNRLDRPDALRELATAAESAAVRGRALALLERAQKG